jgi:hypothetical protein
MTDENRSYADRRFGTNRRRELYSREEELGRAKINA